MFSFFCVCLDRFPWTILYLAALSTVCDESECFRKGKQKIKNKIYIQSQFTLQHGFFSYKVFTSVQLYYKRFIAASIWCV